MKYYISLSLLLGLASSAMDRQALGGWFTGLNTDKVVHAINCGSSEDIQDLLGVTYKADFGFTGGQTSDEGSSV